MSHPCLQLQSLRSAVLQLLEAAQTHLNLTNVSVPGLFQTWWHAEEVIYSFNEFVLSRDKSKTCTTVDLRGCSWRPPGLDCQILKLGVKAFLQFSCHHTFTQVVFDRLHLQFKPHIYPPLLCISTKLNPKGIVLLTALCISFGET